MGYVHMGMTVLVHVIVLAREGLVAEALLAVEHQEVHAEAVQRSYEHAGQHGEIGVARAPDPAVLHRHDDAVLGIETGKERCADQCQ